MPVPSEDQPLRKSRISASPIEYSEKDGILRAFTLSIAACGSSITDRTSSQCSAEETGRLLKWHSFNRFNNVHAKLPRATGRCTEPRDRQFHVRSRRSLRWQYGRPQQYSGGNVAVAAKRNVSRSVSRSVRGVSQWAQINLTRLVCSLYPVPDNGLILGSDPIYGTLVIADVQK